MPDDTDHRLSAVLPERAWTDLRYLARIEGISMTQVIIRALRFRAEYTRRKTRGAKILVEESGVIREIEL